MVPFAGVDGGGGFAGVYRSVDARARDAPGSVRSFGARNGTSKVDLPNSFGDLGHAGRSERGSVTDTRRAAARRRSSPFAAARRRSQPRDCPISLANTFAGMHLAPAAELRLVAESLTTDVADAVASTDAPAEGPRPKLDARELPPPEPLRQTLERVAEMDDDAVLVQLNDRAPQHLYPKLTDRGYEYETVETDDCVVTTIWSES